MALVAGAALLAGACGTPAPKLPGGPATPFPGFAAAYGQASAACSGVRTLTASVSLSGHAGHARLRGRIDAGFAAPARARLEGVAPFGKPIFVLVADDDTATLVLSREDGVLEGTPQSIIEALAGVAIDPASLRTVISGCGFGAGVAGDGESFATEWASGDVAGARVYLRGGAGKWQIAGAVRGPLTVFYADEASGRPATVRILAHGVGLAHGVASETDLTLRLSQVEINTTLDPGTFIADLPEHPVRITLDDLRRAMGAKGESVGPRS